MITPSLMTRRQHCAALMAAVVLGANGASAAGARRGEAFSWESLVARAAALAKRPWRAPPARSHAHAIDYDRMGSIAYREDRTLWPDAGHGAVRFFPLSRFAQMPIKVFVVENGQARPFAYDPALFTAADKEVRALLAQSDGFAGFRALNPGGVGDWLAFQGASYFRSAGPLNQYGLSARGLAINTSVPGVSEEFPSFTHFWLERGTKAPLVIYALLDGPSITGAYRFENNPGEKAVIQDVRAALFARADIAQLGIAPLTSMFWYGEGDRAQGIDWRPEIHDSDGLAMLTGAGERIWRPLENPLRPTTNSFNDVDPKGFGLLQRDRHFDHYQDDGVFYQKRPSLWIEPKGDWGRGAVTLYELPTNKEYEDNIVAFWSPSAPMKRAERRDYAYRMHWIADGPTTTVASAIETWTGSAGRPGTDAIPGARKIVVDFIGGRLGQYRRRGDIEPIVTVQGGQLLEAHAYPIEGQSGKWRLMMDISRTHGEPVDVRAFLRADGTALSETFLYQLDWSEDALPRT